LNFKGGHYAGWGVGYGWGGGPGLGFGGWGKYIVSIM